MRTRPSIRVAGAGHPPGRLRFAADTRRQQGPLPQIDDNPPPTLTRTANMAANQTQLTVMVFPGTQTLPLFAAQARGFFARRGLAVDLMPAPNSEEQRQGLADGRYPIVHGAADQCVALVEASKVDAIVVAGGDNGFNHLFVQPEIERIADLRGRTLVADVANTGWSFVLYEILRRHGLTRGDYRHSRGRRAVPPLRGDARRQDHGGGDPQSAVRDPRPARRAEGHGRGGRHHRPLSRHGALCAARLGSRQCRHAGGLPRGLHRGLALDARSGEQGRGAKARRRAPERAGRHRGGNPRGRRPIRRAAWPGTPPSTWKASRPCSSSAPASRAAPPRRRRSISTCRSTGRLSPGFESGGKPRHNGEP